MYFKKKGHKAFMGGGFWDMPGKCPKKLDFLQAHENGGEMKRKQLV